jgi:hypothetical protein
MLKRFHYLLISSTILALPACGSSNTADPLLDDEMQEDDPIDIINDAALASRIQGAWLGECDYIARDDISEREITAITSTQIIRDFHQFDGADCQGVPRGQMFPLRIYDYELGSDIAANEGTTAAQLNLVIRQLSTAGVLRDAAILDQVRFDIIGIDATGALLRTQQETTTESNRPSSLEGAERFIVKTAITEPSLSTADLVGTYSPGCQPRAGGFSSIVTESVDPDKSVWVEEFHLNSNCAGSPDAAMQRITDYVFGDEFISVFGDTMRRVQTTANPKTILYGEDTVGSLDLGTLRVRYDAIALVDDTLMRGDCVTRVDECKNDSANFSDMIDFELGGFIRYQRVQP